MGSAAAMVTAATQAVTYYLSEHPSIVNFRWSDAQSWGSTWWFLATSISGYILLTLTLHVILLLLRVRRPIPLGPLPALHSLSMALISLTIFAGILLSAAAEIRQTRWLWRRSRTTSSPLQWLLCFPLGTRPSGRVLGIVFTTLVSSVVYGYRFWTAIGLPGACFPFVRHLERSRRRRKNGDAGGVSEDWAVLADAIVEAEKEIACGKDKKVVTFGS
ncbi:Fatty acid elongase 3-like-like protein [Drosera capensis]